MSYPYEKAGKRGEEHGWKAELSEFISFLSLTIKLRKYFARQISKTSIIIDREGSVEVKQLSWIWKALASATSTRESKKWRKDKNEGAYEGRQARKIL